MDVFKNLNFKVYHIPKVLGWEKIYQVGLRRMVLSANISADLLRYFDLLG